MMNNCIKVTANVKAEIYNAGSYSHEVVYETEVSICLAASATETETNKAITSALNTLIDNIVKI